MNKKIKAFAQSKQEVLPTDFASGYRWLVLFVATTVQTTLAFTHQGLGPLVPFLVDGLGLNNTQVGFIGGAVNTGMTLTALLCGRAVDLWGEKIVLIVGCVLAGISIFFASGVHSFSALLVWLLITGMWTAASTPAGSKAIMSWFPPNERGFALGIRQTGTPAAGMLAALSLPAAASCFGWRGAMYVMAGVAIFGAFLCATTYQEQPKVSNLKMGQQSPGKMSEVLKNRNIWIACSTGFAYAGAQFVVLSYLILYLVQKMNFSIYMASMFLALAQLGGVIGRVVWGILSDRLFHGARKISFILIGVITAIMTLIMALLPSFVPLWLVIVLIFCLGFAAIGWAGIYIAMLSEIVHKEQSGTAVGLGSSISQLGIFVFPPLFGFLADRSGSYDLSWMITAGLVLVSVVAFLFVREPSKS